MLYSVLFISVFSFFIGVFYSFLSPLAIKQYKQRGKNNIRVMKQCSTFYVFLFFFLALFRLSLSFFSLFLPLSPSFHPLLCLSLSSFLPLSFTRTHTHSHVFSLSFSVQDSPNFVCRRLRKKRKPYLFPIIARGKSVG